MGSAARSMRVRRPAVRHNVEKVNESGAKMVGRGRRHLVFAIAL